MHGFPYPHTLIGSAMTTLSDEQLVAAAKLGSQGAMTELYMRYRPRVMGFVLRMTSDVDLAEEVFCETFATLFRTLERYQPRSAFAAYVLQIARSKLANEFRARRRLAAGPFQERKLTDIPQSGSLPEEIVASAELSELAQGVLLSLSEDLREIVVLRLYEGLDYRTIGEVVGISAATARSRMCYALQSLRRLLTHISELRSS